MINAQSVCYRYAKRSPDIFKGLTLKLDDYGVYGCVGKNGTGKTTLLKMLAGLIFPTQGELSVFDFIPRQRTAAFLQEIYFLPETIAVPAVSITDYARNYSNFYPKFSLERFSDIIKTCGLNSQRLLTDLSYGEKKKVFIAFGLATQCRLLLLDEPTNGLDIPSKSLFKQIMSSYTAEKSIVIIATHQVHDIENLLDHLIMLDDGRVILNESLLSISDKLVFNQGFVSPTAALYQEKIMGAYHSIHKRDANDETEVNLELLFNALIDKNHPLQQLFGE